MQLKCLTKHEARLRQRALTCVDQEQNSIDHCETTLDLATEVGVTRGVDNVDDHIAEVDGGVLCENGDALLAL
ncbi:unannotated protein [freshwater metagenome]|uniref:Unannotated protein n=1 Tax=freshwater metagenome TaxID=449393 RepID=A0A6J7CZ50_9ZZZZ